MVSVERHWVLLQLPLNFLEIVIYHLSDPWQEIIWISDDVHSGQPRSEDFLQAEYKTQKNTWT